MLSNAKVHKLCSLALDIEKESARLDDLVRDQRPTALVRGAIRQAELHLCELERQYDEIAS